MTLPLPSTNAPLVDPKTGQIKQPWNNYFQQFSAAPAAAINVPVNFTPASLSGGGSGPFTFTANAKGNLAIIGGTVTNVRLIRGSVSLDLGNINLVPISINDTVMITFTDAPTVTFLPSN